VLLINNVVKNIQEMAQTTLNYAIQKGAPILLVAQDFSPAVIKDIIQNNIRNNTQILPIKAEGFGNGKIECLKDIAAITGATIFDNTALANHSGFGACQKVIVSRTSTAIIKSDKVDDSALMERAEMLKERIKAENSAYDKKQLQEKLPKLIGKMAIIHVGGITETIAKERYDRVEDAVYAVRAAIEEGISVGGGMTYYRISNDLAPSNISVGWEILMTALKAPIETLCLNTTGTLTLLEDFEKQHTSSVAVGIDLATKEIVNMKQVGIIDPTKVLRVALENAVAVTGTIINTSGIITGE
jgi:chaperonin GroEL